MSEFAYALNGEPFEVPSMTTGWRVKRIKPKGAPEVVYGADGLALTLPVDASMEDLRREAIVEGKYRLDPVGEDNRVIANVPAGYVYVHKQDRSGELSQVAAVSATSNPLIEAMRLNTELARTVIDRFPVIVDSMSGLVRSVGGVDLPTRAVHNLLGAFAQDAVLCDDDDDDDGALAESRLSGWAAVADKYGPQLIDGLRSLIASGLIKIPGGSGALLDCRLASAAGAEEAAAANAQGAQPAPGPRGPAPARGGGPRSPRSVHNTATGAHRVPGSDQAGAVPLVSAIAARSNDLSAVDPASVAHLTAIRAGLSSEEQMLAQALLTKFSSSERSAWLADLTSLSVRDAIAEVRAVLGTDAPQSPPHEQSATADGGAS